MVQSPPLLSAPGSSRSVLECGSPLPLWDHGGNSASSSHFPQNGMYPGLPAGSGFWAYKHAYSSPSQVKRGDVIVFTRVQNERPYIYIWRVVGLPGDTVAAVGESLTVNARPVTRERIREEQSAVVFRERLDGAAYEVAFSESSKQRPPDSTVIVPAGYFFVMGDNRFSAYDSRHFGPIAFDSIIGKKL